jgi:hypothetical protein
MFDVSEHRKGDKSYFKALGDEIGNDGIESLLHYLTNVNLSGFNPNVLPKSNSAAKFESKLKPTCDVTRWWQGFLRKGNGSPITVPISAGSRLNGWVTWPTNDLHYEYSAPAINKRQRVEFSSSFSIVLRQLCPAIKSTRPMINGKRTRCLEIPSLSECRKAFEDTFDHKVDWDG